MPAREIKDDGFGGLYFEDPAVERAYQEFSIAHGAETFVLIPWIGALIFFVTAPFDYFVFGGGGFNDLVWTSFAVRAVTIVLLVVVGVFLRVAPNRAKSWAIIAGWAVASGATWWLTIVAPPSVALFYLMNLAIISLAIVSLVPVLTIWQTRAMNGFLLLPLVSTGVDNFAHWTALGVVNFAQAGFVLFATVFFGLYSKYTYELALRNEFFRGKQLAAARDQALAADLAKTNFLSAVSHDMRTPLNAILGNVQLLRRGAGGDDAGALLDDTETAGRTLFHLVEGVLHSARGAATEPLPEVVAVAALLDEVRANIQRLADAKGLRLEVSIRGPGTHVRTDPRLVVQVWLNLMSNAAKFTDSGGIGLRVRLRPGRLRFAVFDTGRGMARGDVSRAFERHFIGRETDTAQGFGLGLAISRDILELLGGAMRIRSQPGRGTVVSGWVPVEEAPAGTAPQAVAPAAASQLPRRRVLLVEDEPMNIAVLTRMLAQLGQDFQVAETAAEGLAAYAAETFDVVLSDIRLPDMSGLELLRAIMALPKSQGDDAPPIFAVTANALPEDIARYEAAGFDGVIPKPINLDLLVQVLAQLGGPRLDAGPAAEASVELPAELAALYAQTRADCLAQISAGCAARDAALVGQMAHKLRGAALYAGDADMAARARAIGDALLRDPGVGADPSGALAAIQAQIAELS